MDQNYCELQNNYYRYEVYYALLYYQQVHHHTVAPDGKWSNISLPISLVESVSFFSITIVVLVDDALPTRLTLLITLYQTRSPTVFLSNPAQLYKSQLSLLNSGLRVSNSFYYYGTKN